MAFMMQNNALFVPCWAVLGDLPYSCDSPLNPAPASGLRLPADKHTNILIDFQTQVKKKTKKSAFFVLSCET
jgi:hypothetical protein